MRICKTFLLTIFLLLAACQPVETPPLTSTITAIVIREPSDTPAPPTATPSQTVTPEPVSNRSAAFTMVENKVEAREAKTEDYTPASIGLTLPVGGQAYAGEDGRAALELSPDGTIVRIAPNTIFTLDELKEDNDQPATLLELIVGQIYILLNGGTLKVNTPSGVASVRGSMLGVYFDPITGAMTATCLEGHCSLGNDSGLLELTAGQAADILNGILSSAPRPLSNTELLDWLENNPDIQDMLDQLPPSLRDQINNAQPTLENLITNIPPILKTPQLPPFP